jgi:hypothetical protein
VAKLHKGQEGFSAVETILVLVMVVLIGVVGLMVYKNQNKDSSTDKSTTSSKSETRAESKPVDLLAGGSIYNAADKTFSVKYPKDLLTKDCPSASNGTFFGLAPTSEGLLQDCEGQPKPPYGAVIKFTSYPKAPGFEPNGSDNMDRQAYESETSYSYSTVTLSGHKVEKSVSTLKDDAAIMSGATTTYYRYYDNNEMWEATYTKLPDSKDLTSTFDAMVKTWKF